MGDIKSAWEIAMEKAERLGKLSPDERRRQREQEYSSIGRLLADKYLAGLALWQLEVELDKYTGEQRKLASSALLSRLADAIELGSPERLERALDGILALKQNEPGVAGIKDEIVRLLREYRQEEDRGKREAEESAREVLSRLGISGSAVGSVRPETIPECKQSLDDLARPYEQRLGELKARLAGLWQADTRKAQ
ncbi:MAG: hypothetical protein DRI40_00450 [Chloroflexi bacterium]|nr:MAG: hypothetical protein DRI40_00450 [Chloroflexota bacterium]